MKFMEKNPEAIMGVAEKYKTNPASFNTNRW